MKRFKGIHRANSSEIISICSVEDETSENADTDSTEQIQNEIPNVDQPPHVYANVIVLTPGTGSQQQEIDTDSDDADRDTGHTTLKNTSCKVTCFETTANEIEGSLESLSITEEDKEQQEEDVEECFVYHPVKWAPPSKAETLAKLNKDKAELTTEIKAIDRRIKRLLNIHTVATSHGGDSQNIDYLSDFIVALCEYRDDLEEEKLEIKRAIERKPWLNPGIEEDET